MDFSLRGWQTACPAASNIGRFDITTPKEAGAGSAKTFIADHAAAMDLCANPGQIPIHGFTAGKSPHHSTLKPLFCLSKTNLHADILGVPTEQWTGNVRVVPWEQKTENRLLWRGSNTGSLFNKQTPWRDSHRIRLVRMSLEDEGKTQMLPLARKANGKASSVALGAGMWGLEKRPGGEKYLDFNFTGQAIRESSNLKPE